jgi:plastocyanin
MTRSWLRRAIVAAAALGAIAVAGCSSAAPSGAAGATSAAGQRVTIEGNNSLRFTPMTVHVHAGTVRITLKDMGAYPHNLVIPGLRVTSPTVTGDPGGATARFTITFPHAGRYPFHCQYHQSAGMTGVFVVS